MKRRLLRNFLFTVLTCSLADISFGQQQVMFTQYMFNGLALNPAYAGSDETLNLTILAREQWLGFDGGPTNQMFSGHLPLGPQKKIGVGLTVEKEKIAVTEVMNFYASYAYKIPVKNGHLALGLQGGLTHHSQELTALTLPPGVVDPSFDENISSLLPNFGTGIYYSSKRFYAGFSIPMLIQNSFDNRDAVLVAKQARHYFLTSGYLIDLNPTLKLKPHILIKSVEGAPLNIDLNANLLIKELVWLGASFRNLNSLNALLEIQLNRQLRLGFAFDFINSELGNVSSGSGEIMLNYRVSKKVPERVLSPRYF
ncbi:type IX secretion system membrane protein PorP/SprF [Fulvivirgaceae bacterium BMA12]|uniref:Type IX secretion system membrane protein PorP/SprF n=1 Tax=Agaribacillus aureus TaxID=3051825 RepID=A0ABT8LHH8_9BACT|nr:type IX secretion system membrane protein PorP/SprF [Fulvivirgaceae bacterium BMA12]